jgi:hypothetical protein
MAKKLAAVFTIVQNEPTFLPIWSRYYRQHFRPEDVFVLDHDSTDLTTVATASTCNRVPVHNSASFEHQWLRLVVQNFQRFLLQSYEYVLFAEVDEIVLADPTVFSGGLVAYVEYMREGGHSTARCQGHELVHDMHQEPSLDLSVGKKIFAQRRWLQASQAYSKTLLSAVPLTWSDGFHTVCGQVNMPDNHLHLVHLHRMDFDLAWAKCQDTAKRKWNPEDAASGAGYQNRFTDVREFESWFYRDFHDGKPFNPRPMFKAWKDLI